MSMTQTPTDPPWRDAETLRRLHWDEGLHQGEIAERLGCTRRTVSEWFGRLGVKARMGQPRRVGVYYKTDHSGYERWQDKCQPSLDKIVKVHRLLAVAENGFEAVRDMHVHHKNGIPWDNRPDNIELLTPSEHQKRHHETTHDFQGSGNPNAKFSWDDIREIRSREDSASASELAEEFDTTPAYIGSIWRGDVWSEDHL